ncbi:MAG: glycosyltransferase family 10 domain-containing protein [Luteolibacter sp.]
MIRAKFISRVRIPDQNVGNTFLRRFDREIPIMGDVEFIFDPQCRDYDWLIVYDDLPRDYPVEELACPSSNTLLITGEPSSITRYGANYLAQFCHVLTSQEKWAIQHPCAIHSQAGLLWYYGGLDHRGSYKYLVETPPIPKTKSIASVCSTKSMKHTLHSKRLAFTRRLMTDLPELDVFGYGMKPLENKADAIDSYRYHLVIENHSCQHHWTEKLADAFLGYSVPIYFGCTNLKDYFPKESFITIDINDYGKSLEAIRKTISDSDYQERLPAIIEARSRVLHQYSTFPNTAKLITELVGKKTTAPSVKRIYGRKRFRTSHPLKAFSDRLFQSM